MDESADDDVWEALYAHAETCPSCLGLLAEVGRARAGQATEQAVTHASGVSSAVRAVGRGDTVGAFELREELGRGGMGVVHAAWDGRLQRTVAIKVLSRTGLSAAESKLVERLLREARAMAAVDHPNVVRVLEVDPSHEPPFVVMELVDGTDLAGWLQEEEPGWREIVRIWIAAGRGLVAAHEAGLVHRDFKPANVLVGRDGRIRVTDFGLAGLTSDAAAAARDDATGERGSSGLTQTRHGAGTPKYMAPEQYAGGSVEAAADQYAYSVSLYEALTGQHPFADGSLGTLAGRVARGEVRELSAPVEAPQRVIDIALRGMSVRPEDRFPSLAELLAALESTMTRGAQRRRWVGGVLVATGLVAAGVWAGRRDDPADPCGEVMAAAEEAWSPARREALQAGVEGAGGPAVGRAVVAGLDQWIDEWKTGRRDACEATLRAPGEGSDAALIASCLDRRLLRLDATLSVLAEDSSALAGSVEILEALPRPSACESPKAWPPSTGATAAERKAYAELRNRLERTLANRIKGVDVIPDLSSLLEEARNEGIELAAIEVAAYLGRQHLALGDHAAAQPLLEEALLRARTMGDASSAALALRLLADLHGVYRDQEELALWMLEEYRALTDRLPDPDDALANYAVARGKAFVRGKEYPKAVPHFERAIEARRARGQRYTAAHVSRELAQALAQVGRTREAATVALDALRDADDLLGPMHPLRAGLLAAAGRARFADDPHEGLQFLQDANAIMDRVEPPMRARGAARSWLARARGLLGDTEGAVEASRRAVADFEREYGDVHQSTQLERFKLAGHLRRVGLAEAARPMHETYREWSTARGRSPEALAWITYEIADDHRVADRCDRAEPLYREVLDVLDVLPDEQTSASDRAYPVISIALCARRAGDLLRARELVDSVLSQLDPKEADEIPHGLAHFAWAMILRDLGEEGAEDAARRAKKLLEVDQRLVKQVDRWLDGERLPTIAT